MPNSKMEIIRQVSIWQNSAKFVILKIVTQLLFLVAIILPVSLAPRDAMIALFVVHHMKIS